MSDDLNLPSDGIIRRKIRKTFFELVDLMDIDLPPVLTIYRRDYWGGSADSIKNRLNIFYTINSMSHNLENHPFFEENLNPHLMYVHILAHELQHFKQYQNGSMRVFNNFYAWNGRVYLLWPVSSVDYYELPWEKEANTVAKEIITNYSWDELKLD